MNTFKMIGYPFGAAVVASFFVLLIGMVMFGFRIAEWSESEGRIMGIVATFAGIAGAIIGLLRAKRRQVK